MSSLIHPVYFFPGPEVGRKQARIDEIHRNITNKDHAEPECHHIYPYDNKITDVISLLQNGSLFSSRRLVVFSDVHALSAADIKSISRYIDAPTADAILVLTTDQAPGSRTYPFKLAAAIPKKKDNIEVFWEMFEKDKRGWVTKFFRDKNIQIDSEAVDVLLDVTEGTTDALKEACERLTFASKNQIDLDDVDKVLEHDRGETVYSLFNRFCRRDFGGTLEAYRTMLHSDPASVENILIMLADPLIRLMDFKIRIARGLSENHAASEVKIKGGKRAFRAYCDGARQYSSDELQEAARSLIDLEAWLREAPHELRIRKIELWFSRIINRGYG